MKPITITDQIQAVQRALTVRAELCKAHGERPDQDTQARALKAVWDSLIRTYRKQGNSSQQQSILTSVLT